MRLERISLGNNVGVTLTCYLQDFSLFGKKTPAVIVCPGGGYTYHNESEGENVAMAFYAQGFSAFVLHYSVGLQALYPQTIVDASAAVATVRRHAEEWGIAPDAIAFGGFSAGGHMAAALGTLWNNEEVQRLAGVSGAENRPDVIFLVYPAINVDLPAEKGGKLGDQPVYCEKLVGAHTPPAFMVHSYGDTVAPLEQSLRFAKAMYDHDRPIECHFYTPGQHSALVRRSSNISSQGIRIPHFNDWFLRCVEWMWDMFGHQRQDMVSDRAPETAAGWERPHLENMGSLLGGEDALFEKVFGVPQPKGPGITGRTPLRPLLENPETHAILRKYFPILDTLDLSSGEKEMQLGRLMAIGGYRENQMSFELPSATGEMLALLEELNSVV